MVTLTRGNETILTTPVPLEVEDLIVWRKQLGEIFAQDPGTEISITHEGQEIFTGAVLASTKLLNDVAVSLAKPVANQSFVWGTDLPETIPTSQDHTISEMIIAGAGDDTIIGSGGFDLVRGGDGRDTLDLSILARSSVTIEDNGPDNVLVTHVDSGQTIEAVDIELIGFSDTTVDTALIV